MQNVDPNLTHSMKCYHEKNNKEFVQQPVLVTQVCAYRHFYNDTHRRVKQSMMVTEKEGGKNNKKTYSRVRTESVGETAYKHQPPDGVGGGGVACFILIFVRGEGQSSKQCFLHLLQTARATYRIGV